MCNLSGILKNFYDCRHTVGAVQTKSTISHVGSVSLKVCKGSTKITRCFELLTTIKLGTISLYRVLGHRNPRGPRTIFTYILESGERLETG